MPLIIILLLALLIAPLGFWSTLGAILGAIGMVVLLVVLAIGIIVAGGVMVARNFNRRLDPPRDWR